MEMYNKLCSFDASNLDPRRKFGLRISLFFPALTWISFGLLFHRRPTVKHLKSLRNILILPSCTAYATCGAGEADALSH
jgi:hypothetical protein